MADGGIGHSRGMIYAEWKNIRQSAKFYKTPKDIRNAMDALYASVDAYIERHATFCREMQDHINDVFNEKTGGKINLENFGENLLEFALESNFYSMDLILYGRPYNTLTNEHRTQMHSIITQEIFGMPSFLELEELSRNWEEREQNAIDRLKKRIEKFERKFKT